MLLTLQHRFEHYESKGALFDQIQEGVFRHRLNERLWGLFVDLLNIIDTLFDSAADENDIIERIFADEKAYALLNRVFRDDVDVGNAA